MKELSPKQKRILAFIEEYTEERGYPPSIREICNACEISSTSVADYNLNILEKRGLIRRDPDVSRGIEVINKRRRRSAVLVPIIGQIAAGQPLPVPDSATWQTSESAETVEVSPELLRGKSDVYALKVKGSSMTDALINDGDIVLMEAIQAADDGTMVAAWLKSEKEATLKRLYRERGRIRLQPANTNMQPIFVDPEDVEVQGRVVGVIRKF